MSLQQEAEALFVELRLGSASVDICNEYILNPSIAREVFLNFLLNYYNLSPFELCRIVALVDRFKESRTQIPNFDYQKE